MVLLSLGLAEVFARRLHLDRAVGVLCLASLSSLLVSARLGGRSAQLGVASLAVLSVPAVFSQRDPLLATIVLTATALGLGLSARWQLKPVYWLLVVILCILITSSPLPPNPTPMEVARLAIGLLGSGSGAVLLQSKLVFRFAGAPLPVPFAVVHSWRRSGAHALMLASAAVVSTAIAMPLMPNRLPRIEVVGCDKPFKAWMKQMLATKYKRTTRFMLICQLLLWGLFS